MEALNIVANHNEGEELKRLKEENARLRDALNFVQQTASDKSDYYFDLVWFARSPNPLQWVPNFFEDTRSKLGEEKFVKFRRDIEALSSPHAGDWNHGFNSGCLAMARLLGELSAITEPRSWDDNGGDSDEEENVESIDEQRQNALSEFPFLDT